MIPDWPLNVTLVTPVKWKPVICITVPESPCPGEKPVINGSGPTTVNEAKLLLVPLIVLTLITPLVAPGGTRVVIWVPAEFAENSALTPAKLTPRTFTKCTPVIITVSLTEPYMGEKLEM